MSLRETLQAVERMTGRVPAEAINPFEPPDVLYDLWHWFLDLNSARGAGMSGPLPITYLDLHAYSQLHGIRFADWEMQAIKQLDAVALSDDPMKE